MNGKPNAGRRGASVCTTARRALYQACTAPRHFVGGAFQANLDGGEINPRKLGHLHDTVPHWPATGLTGIISEISGPCPQQGISKIGQMTKAEVGNTQRDAL